jgi:hypothetical protein
VVLGSICRHYDLCVPAGAKVTPYLGVTLLPQDNLLPLEVRQRRPAGSN